MDNRDGEWIVAGASVRGTSHERRDQPCQDAHLTSVTKNGELLVAVADGTGSARYAEEGATTAVQAAVDFFEERVSEFYKEGEVWKTLLQGAAAHALQALKDLAGEMNVPVRELSCTLLLAIATRERFFALQIGDGAIVRETPDGPEALFKPTSGEYINESVFLVTQGAIEQAKLAERPGPATPFVVFSDGLQMLALRMPEGAPEPGFFKPLFKLAKRSASRDEVMSELRAFLGSSRVRERADDDLTLVLAAPRGADALDKGDAEPSSLPQPAPALSESKQAEPTSKPKPSSASTLERPSGPKEPQRAQAARDQPKGRSREAAPIPAYRGASAMGKAGGPQIALGDTGRRSNALSERAAEEQQQGVIPLVIAFVLGMASGGVMVYLLMRDPAPEPRPSGGPNVQAIDHKPQSVAEPNDRVPRGEWLDECENDAWCGPLLTCVRRRCRTKSHLGEACDAKDMCVAGAECARGVCGKIKYGKRRLSDPCAADHECTKELVCVLSKCADQKRGPEQSCHNDNDCDDAYSLLCKGGRCAPRWP